MCKTLLIAVLLAAAALDSAVAATPLPPAPKTRTALQTITFEELEKNIAFEIVGCKRLHGIMTKIISATMRGDTLVIMGDANKAPIDSYPMKKAPTAEQLKALNGKPICDPN
jgi:hypothetical protein